MRAKRKSIQARKDKVLERDNFTCVYCDGPGLWIDHILPWSWNGDDRESNLVACCEDCNLIASDNLFPSFQDKKDYILAVRSSRRWQTKFRRRTSICTSCKKVYNPRVKGASMFLCSRCNDD